MWALNTKSTEPSGVYPAKGNICRRVCLNVKLLTVSLDTSGSYHIPTWQSGKFVRKARTSSVQSPQSVGLTGLCCLWDFGNTQFGVRVHTLPCRALWAWHLLLRAAENSFQDSAASQGPAGFADIPLQAHGSEVAFSSLFSSEFAAHMCLCGHGQKTRGQPAGRYGTP